MGLKVEIPYRPKLEITIIFITLLYSFFFLNLISPYEWKFFTSHFRMYQVRNSMRVQVSNNNPGKPDRSRTTQNTRIIFAI